LPYESAIGSRISWLAYAARTRSVVAGEAEPHEVRADELQQAEKERRDLLRSQPDARSCVAPVAGASARD
jgi:hypothetical protein